MKTESIDTSFSGIVSKIQHDIPTAIEVLIALTDKIKSSEEELRKIDAQAVSCNTELRLCFKGIVNVAAHLELPFPIRFTRDNDLYTLDCDTIAINALLNPSTL
jgi:hypothetical protein